jgi:hypothetical protein
MQANVAGLAQGNQVRRVMIRLLKISMVDNKVFGALACVAFISIAISNLLAQPAMPSDRVGQNRAATTPVRISLPAINLGISLAPLFCIRATEPLCEIPFSKASSRAKTVALHSKECNAAPPAQLQSLNGLTVPEHRVLCARKPGGSFIGTLRRNGLHVLCAPDLIALPRAEIVREYCRRATSANRNIALITGDFDHVFIVVFSGEIHTYGGKFL